MKHSLSLALIATLFVIPGLDSVAADNKPVTAPPPMKDAQAKQKHAQGSGIFLVTLSSESTGKVKCVGIHKSTGNVFLDVDGLNTLLQWRFKPTAEKKIAVRITFTAESDAAAYAIEPSVPKSRPFMPGCFSAPETAGRLNQMWPKY